MDTTQSNGHKRAVIYCRVSTEEQAETGYSLQSQVEACRKYAADNGFTIAGVFQDDCSGTKLDRPQFTAAREALTDHTAEALIVYSSDRLTRKLAHKLIIREELQRAGVELHYVRRGKSEDTPEHKMTENIEGVFDEYWREKILESSKRGMDAKARSGKLIGGRAPYGYFFRDGALFVDDFEAEIVRQIYTWYVSGDETGKPLTLYQIAKRLSEAGVPTPGESRHSKRQRAGGMWSDGTIGRMLTYEVYTGVFRYGRLIGSGGKNGKRAIEDTIKIDVPALIDAGLWQAAQHRKQHNRAISPRNSKLDYLLRGLIFCGCGRRMVGYNANTQYTTHYRYKCGSTHPLKGEDRVCHEPVYEVIGRKVEAWVWEQILNVMTDPAEFEKALREAQQAELDTLEPKRARLAVVLDLIKQCEDEAATTAAAVKVVGGVVGDKLQADINQINQRHAELSAERDALQAAVNARLLTDEDIAAALQFREDTIEGLQNPTFDDMRRMLEILQVKITVKDGIVTLACCFPTFCPSFDYQTVFDSAPRNPPASRQT
jgi:site-specific DNA recombinase